MSTTPNDEREALRDRLAEAMRSAHSSGDTVSSPRDAADFALNFLLTDEGWHMLEAAWAESANGRCPTCGGVGPDRVDTDSEGGVEFACGDEWHDAANGSSEAPR